MNLDDWFGDLSDDRQGETSEPPGGLSESEDGQPSQQGGCSAASLPSTTGPPVMQVCQGTGQQPVSSPWQVPQLNNDAVSLVGAFGSLAVDGSGPPSRPASMKEQAPEPARSADEPAENAMEVVNVDGSDDYGDDKFEEIELAEPEEPEEGWDDLGSEHAPQVASQNTSYPGPRPGFMSHFFPFTNMK